MENPDPVFYNDGDARSPDYSKPGWYFYDETWAYAYGPYDTKEAANTACNEYANTL